MRALLVPCLLAGCAAAADPRVCDPAEGSCEAPTLGAVEGGVADDTWVDTSYEYVTSRTDALAVWLDSYFGTPTSDRESADTVLRLRNELVLDEDDGVDTGVRLRGKIDVPRLDRRLSLVFSEENEEYEEVVPDSAGRNDDVGLQFRLADRGSSRLWVSLGVNNSLDLRTSLRYKHVRALGEDWRLQFGEKLYHKQEEGFGALTRVDLDYLIATDRMVRWTNQVDYGEETAGAEWGSRLSYQIRIDSRQALSYFTSVSGQTDPDYLTRGYGVGVRYRRNVLRPWMFVEVEPAHVWRRDTLGEPREPVWMLTFRLELIEEHRNRRGEARRDDARVPVVD